MTASLGELVPVGSGRVGSHELFPQTQRSLDRMAAQLEAGPTSRGVALVDAAFSAGADYLPAARVALGLLADDSLTQLEHDIAAAFLRSDQPPPADTGFGDQRPIWLRIAKLKAILVREPNNAVRWMDLGREYFALGQKKHAERAVGIALALRPSNRFIVRCAVAFFEHGEDFDRAQHVLQQSGRLETDPWLLAAAVAMSDLQKQGGKYLRQARALLERGDLSPWDSAELLGATATVEIGGGRARHSRRLMRRALECPTENVLAQAEWAREHGLLESFEDASAGLEPPRAFEAASIREGRAANWDSSATSAKLWVQDQPFSLQAAVYGSWVAAQGGEYELAASLAEAGLIANPSGILQNNLAYALACEGRLADATDHLAKAWRLEMDSAARAHLTATRGLILFRAGEIAGGRRSYLESIRALTGLRQKESAAMACVLLAEEEIRANGEVDDAFLRAAAAIGSTARTPALRARWESLEQLSKGAVGRVGRRSPEETA